MSSPIGHGFNFGDQPSARPFIALFGEARELTENHLSQINGGTCGFLFGSSAGLPFLYPLKLRGLYLLDFGIFLCSAVLFTFLNAAEIAENAKYTLAGSVIVVIFVLLSQRISPEAFGSYIPIWIALSLLVTIHVVPWIRTSIQQRNAITLGDYVMATRGDIPGGSYRAAVDPFSIRSVGASRRDMNQDFELVPHPLVFDHMGYIPGQYQMRGPDSPDHSSSVDLESGLHQEAGSSTASAGSRDHCL